MKFTEERLKLYAAPLSDTENEKCLHAIKEIRDALKDLGYYSTSDSVVPIETDTYSYSSVLKRAYSTEEIQIFIQGSYANNTCVRGDSDVDIATAKASGMPCISVLWGFRNRQFLIEHGGTTFIHHPSELLSLI